jgi:hypothetical protein
VSSQPDILELVQAFGTAVGQAIAAAVTDVRLHVVFEQPLEVHVRYPRPAAGMFIAIKEKQMPHTITVDTTNETATVAFTDDHGNATSPPAGFGSIAFESSDPSVLTVAADPTNPLVGNLTPTGTPGTGVTITAPAVDASGVQLMEADGVTPFSATSEALDVTPGAPAGEQITLAP